MMLKKFAGVTIALLMMSGFLYAQNKIEKSNVFQEPLSDGWTKMIVLKNGNTFYFHYGSKKGIETFVWDKNKKLTNKTAIKSDNWSAAKKRHVKICGLYEIAGEPVIFVEYFQKKVSKLYSLRLNPANGALLKEDKVYEMPRQYAWDIYGNPDADDYNQDVIVEKDAQSDNYAIIYFNIKKDMDQRIKVQLFDGSHKVINSGTYLNPDPSFKRLSYIGSVVDSNKRVFIATYGAAAKGKNAHVFIASLHPDDTMFINKQLDFTEDFKNTMSQMVYNYNNNSIVMLTNTVAENKGYSTNYASFVSYIDASSLNLMGVNNVDDEKINAYAAGKFTEKLAYFGLPQKAVVNDDNSISLLHEEITYEIIRRRTKHGMEYTSGIYTLMGNIGITELDNSGKEKDGYALMKKQVYGGKLLPQYMAGRDKGLWLNEGFSKSYVDDNLFCSYEYIHTPACSYVLFNDNPKNNKKKENHKKRKYTVSTDFINTICYKLKDGVATKTFLFGEPKDKKHSKACYIETSYFDHKTNTYATILSEASGRKYESRVAWIKFE